LIEKWKKEGRHTEMEELDAFSNALAIQTPRYYIIKWLTDYIADYGIDGYRADTVHGTSVSDFKAQSDMHLPLGRKTIQQKC
jgi:alpha-amylase